MSSFLLDSSEHDLNSVAGDERTRSTAKPAQSHLDANTSRLVARARAGEERAMREIYRTHQQRVRAHLHRMLGEDADIDDVMQTVFVRAFRALEGFKGESTLRTWLYRITVNTTHNLLRSRYRQQRIRRAFGRFVNANNAHVPATRVNARDEAARALACIAPDLQEVFVLYHYEGLTLKEISAVVGRPISTIGDRLARARQRLKGALEL